MVGETLALQFGRRIGGNFNAAHLQNLLLISHQIAQFMELHTHVLAGLLEFLTKLVQVLAIATEVSSRFNTLLGVGSGAIDEFKSLEGLSSSHSSQK